jgi:hypothetical protein
MVVELEGFTGGPACEGREQDKPAAPAASKINMAFFMAIQILDIITGWSPHFRKTYTNF